MARNCFGARLLRQCRQTVALIPQTIPQFTAFAVPLFAAGSVVRRRRTKGVLRIPLSCLPSVHRACATHSEPLLSLPKRTGLRNFLSSPVPFVPTCCSRVCPLGSFRASLQFTRGLSRARSRLTSSLVAPRPAPKRQRRRSSDRVATKR